MRLDTTIRNIRVALRANSIIAGLYGRQVATQSGVVIFAALIGAFGLLMLSVAVFFALQPYWGSAWAAAAVGIGDLVIAAVLVLVAGNMKPGRELDLATEVRNNAVETLLTDVREVEADVASFFHSVRHPIDSSLIASLATPIVSLFLKSTKGEQPDAKKAADERKEAERQREDAADEREEAADERAEAAAEREQAAKERKATD
jgi:hypothetical protein